MGGAVSAGVSNDELIDNLVEADYIKSPLIERVFRSVDRGFYFKEGHRDNAYRDTAWKLDNLHISAPCIYSEVMEALQLARGQSFLNLGSGTGYVSTMIGLILGPYGINHGVEYYEDVVEYARLRWQQFKSTSPTIDTFDGFAEPKFFHGNCLNLDIGSIRLYDRVYCGAGVSPEHESYMKRLIAINGILVMPFNDNLVQITRVGPNSWKTRNILPVSFASLISSNKSDGVVKLDEVHAMPLQDISRFTIRSIIRSKFNTTESESLQMSKRRRVSEKRTTASKIARVIFPDADSDSELEIRVDFRKEEDSDNGRKPRQEGTSSEDEDRENTPNSGGETGAKDVDERSLSPDKETCEVARSISRDIENGIRSLPLPTFLKIYVNLDRPFRY